MERTGLTINVCNGNLRNTAGDSVDQCGNPRGAARGDRGLNRVNIGLSFEAGISIVFLAIIIDRITTAFARAKKVEAATGDDTETEASEEAEDGSSKSMSDSSSLAG